MSPVREWTIKTAPDRVRLLLPWLNEDRAGRFEVRARLLGFLASFDGSAEAGHVRVSLDRLKARPEGRTAQVAKQFDILRISLRSVLLGDEEVRSFRSLRFGIRRRDSVAGLMVEGSMLDLVPWLLLHLLTAPGCVGAVLTCEAPKPNDWTDRCRRWFVRAGGVGRPQDYCSARCRVRARAERKAEEQRNQISAKQQQHRRKRP